MTWEPSDGDLVERTDADWGVGEILIVKDQPHEARVKWGDGSVVSWEPLERLRLVGFVGDMRSPWRPATTA